MDINGDVILMTSVLLESKTGHFALKYLNLFAIKLLFYIINYIKVNIKQLSFIYINKIKY